MTTPEGKLPPQSFKTYPMVGVDDISFWAILDGFSGANWLLVSLYLLKVIFYGVYHAKSPSNQHLG